MRLVLLRPCAGREAPLRPAAPVVGVVLIRTAVLGAGLLLGAAVGSGAVAQTVYRCGSAGHTSYQTEPCSGGKAIDASDPRTEEQRRAAREASGSDARLADRLERERRVREATTIPARAGGIGGTPPVAIASEPWRRHVRRHHYARGVRYFPDGTPMPPVYRVPATPGQAKKK